jgi:nuclear pore complex protein Nup155
MRSKDELFHVAVYDWLLNAQLTDRLLEVNSPFIEEYLKRSASSQVD